MEKLYSTQSYNGEKNQDFLSSRTAVKNHIEKILLGDDSNQKILSLLEVFDIFHDFEDLIIRVILREFPQKVMIPILIAYKITGQPEKSEIFYRNIPKQTAQILKDDTENISTVDVRELAHSVQLMVDILLRLAGK